MSAPVLDFGNMLSPRLGGAPGIDPARLEGDLVERFERSHAWVEALRARGQAGFFDLPYASETLGHVRQAADGFGQWFENVVVLGIGGSSLGTISLRDALLGQHWNELDDDGRDHYPRL